MVYLIIIAVLGTACKYFYDNYKLALKHINLLHFENENYLNVLMSSDIIPEKLGKEKIERMNKEYGKVEMKVKE